MGFEKETPGALGGATGARDTKADDAGAPEDNRFDTLKQDAARLIAGLHFAEVAR